MTRLDIIINKHYGDLELVREGKRNRIKRRIRDDLYNELDRMPEHKYTMLHVTGSMETGLVSETSDLDFVVELMEDGLRDHLMRLARALKTRLSRFHVDTTLPDIRVPLIKTTHKRTGIKVDISFMCPSLPRWFAINNTRLIKNYATYDVEMAKAFVFLKHVLGYKRSFSAQTQGVSSYGWTILMLRYSIKTQRIFVNTDTFDVSVGDQRSPASEVLKGFLNFVLEDLPWEDVDITVNDTDMERRSIPKIPRIQDPYEKQRDLACYLNDSTWDRLREDVENLVRGLQRYPTAVYHGAWAQGGSLKKEVPSVRQNITHVRTIVEIG